MRCYYAAIPLTVLRSSTYSVIREAMEKAATVLADGDTYQIKEGRFASADEWQFLWGKHKQEWARDGLFFVADADGWIGKGVWTQIVDVLKEVHAPIWFVDKMGYHKVTEGDDTEVDFIELDEDNWRRYTKPYVLPLVEKAIRTKQLQ